MARGSIIFFICRCPEVGLNCLLIGVQRLNRIFIFRCSEVVSYFVVFVVVAVAAVSVVIWRLAMGWSLSIWNARMMQLIIFFGRTLGEVARGAHW